MKYKITQRPFSPKAIVAPWTKTEHTAWEQTIIQTDVGLAVAFRPLRPVYRNEGLFEFLCNGKIIHGEVSPCPTRRGLVRMIRRQAKAALAGATP